MSLFVQGKVSTRFLFFSLLFFSTGSAGRDCDLSDDGYIMDHWDIVTDNCDHECGWVKCGDVCIFAKADNRCYCGEERLRLVRGYDYCCVDHSPDNRTQCSVDRYGDGHCPLGRVVSMSKTCNNHCFNDYETSAVVGWGSQYRCGDHQCVPTWFMCRGFPLCPDSRDVSECGEDLKCVLDSDYSYSKGVLVSDLSGGHYYCDYDNSYNDGIYDTITREDETDLNILSRKVQINYTSITECADQYNQPGLMCGERCLPTRNWCQGGSSCGKYNFSTNNKQLCANTTFWSGKTCEKFYSNGYKAALGRRCTGAAQHCIYPWYTSSIYNYEVSVGVECTFMKIKIFKNEFVFFYFSIANIRGNLRKLVKINLTKYLLCISPALRRNLSRNIMSQSALESIKS